MRPIMAMLGIMKDMLPFMPSIIIIGFIAGLGGGFNFWRRAPLAPANERGRGERSKERGRD
jgi:hypothetical protein